MTKPMMPLPIPSHDDKEFWEGCARHELLIQRCGDCGTFRFPPRPMCHNCASMNMEWAKVSGKGEIYSWINVVHPVHPAMIDRVPFAVVLVELDDAPGARLVSNMVDCESEEIEIGMPVQVMFEDVAPEITLYKFKRAA